MKNTAGTKFSCRISSLALNCALLRTFHTIYWLIHCRVFRHTEDYLNINVVFNC